MKSIFGLLAVVLLLSVSFTNEAFAGDTDPTEIVFDISFDTGVDFVAVEGVNTTEVLDFVSTDVESELSNSVDFVVTTETDTDLGGLSSEPDIVSTNFDNKSIELTDSDFIGYIKTNVGKLTTTS